MLRIALPSGKSLEQRTLELFLQAGIEICREGACSRMTFPTYPALSEGIFLKPVRIPKLVESGYFDIGITGQDLLIESRAAVWACAYLPYSRSSDSASRAVLIADKNDPVTRIEDVPPGSTIFSEYPRETDSIFSTLGIPVKIEASPGTTEAEIPWHYRFGICLSETGRSLEANNLKIISVLFESHTLLIANEQACENVNAPKRTEIEALRTILMNTLEARRPK
jgi:ATP phosphoribosyltransferase